MGVLSNKVDREQLKPGDHIYSWRQLYIYAHHGIYVGDGMVIHFTRGVGQEVGTGTILDRLLVSSVPRHDTSNPCPICGDQSNKEGVISSCLDCFLYGGNLCLFAYGVSRAFFLAQARGGTCTCAPSDPTEDVLHRASILLEHGFGAYDIFKNNCEDFAIYCKTGLLVCSGQAASCLAAADAVFLAAFRKMINPSLVRGLAMVGYGMYSYCANRLASDIGRRHDAFKIPVECLIASLGLNEPENTAEVPMERPITSPTTNYGTVDSENLVQRSECNGSEQLFVENGTGLHIARTDAERRKKEEAERRAKLAEIAEKQRQREGELEEKERQRREALLGRGTEPTSRPSKPPTRPPESGSAVAAGPAPGKYVPRFKREKERRGRQKEEAERRAKLAEIAEKQRQSERKLEEKERQRKETLLGRGTEPASRPSEPSTWPPVSGSAAAAGPAPGKYVPRFKREKERRGRKKEEAEHRAKLAEIAEKQRQKDQELEEKERQRREALLGRGTEPPSRPSEPPTHPLESGSAAAAGPAPGKYVPTRSKRQKKRRGRKNEKAERLAEIAEKHRQRERELEEKERQRREALLGRGTEPASRPSEPPTYPPESGSAAPVATTGPRPGKYVPRFKREKSNGSTTPPSETYRWTSRSKKLDGDRWRSDDRRPAFGSGGGSRSSPTWSSSRNQRDR